MTLPPLYTPPEMPGLKEVVLSALLPKCDLCTRLTDTPPAAAYDARLADGRWGYVCHAHAHQQMIRVGLGWGQRLKVRPGTP